MAEKFKVEVVTPKGVVLNKEVEEVIAPGVMGEFGVLIGHTPMLTFIKPGVLSYLENNTFTKFVVARGFCEVLKDSVSVLVEEAIPIQEVDSVAAETEASQLEQELASLDPVENSSLYKDVQGRLMFARAKATISKS
jgi:F-type H+-transporting ATPase subunit epsilon